MLQIIIVKLFRFNVETVHFEKTYFNLKSFCGRNFVAHVRQWHNSLENHKNYNIEGKNRKTTDAIIG